MWAIEREGSFLNSRGDIVTDWEIYSPPGWAMFYRTRRGARRALKDYKTYQADMIGRFRFRIVEYIRNL